MTKYLSLLIVTLILAGLLAAPAFAYQGYEGKRGMRWQELNLSEEQQVQLDKIREAHRDKMMAKRKEMKAAKDKLRTALQGDASNKALRGEFKKLQALRNEFATMRFEKILTIRDILTPEQRKKFKAMKRRHPKHGPGPGHPPGSGPGPEY